MAKSDRARLGLPAVPGLAKRPRKGESKFSTATCHPTLKRGEEGGGVALPRIKSRGRPLPPSLIVNTLGIWPGALNSKPKIGQFPRSEACSLTRPFLAWRVGGHFII